MTCHNVRAVPYPEVPHVSTLSPHVGHFVRKVCPAATRCCAVHCPMVQVLCSALSHGAGAVQCIVPWCRCCAVHCPMVQGLRDEPGALPAHAPESTSRPPLGLPDEP